MKRIAWQSLLGIVVVIAGAAGAAAQDADKKSDPRSAEERIEELDQKIRVLERKAELDKDAAADKAKKDATVKADKDGFQLKSADGAFVLKIRGYLQADGRFIQNEPAKAVTDTFLLRRVRPIIEGTLWNRFDYRIMPDFGGGTTVLYDAYLEARLSPFAKLRAGKFKPPVGLERLQSATDIEFVERALPTNLVPNRDVGLQIGGDWDKLALSYAVGVFNGVPDGTLGDSDTNDKKDFAARFFLQPFKATEIVGLQGFGIGAAGTWGSQQGFATTSGSTVTITPGLPSYKSPAQQTIFAYRTDKTLAKTVIADGKHTRVAPQLYYYVPRFGLIGEYVESEQEVLLDKTSAKLKHTAWQATGTFVVTGETPSFKGVTPKRPFDPKNHGWGAFELVARVSQLKLDPDTFPTFADPTTSVSKARSKAAGVNWWLNRNVKLMVDYEKTTYDGGAANGANREDEKVIFTRFQIAY